MMMLMVIMMMVTASLGMREPMTSGASCFRDYRKCLWTRLPLTPPPTVCGDRFGHVCHLNALDLSLCNKYNSS